ncbi:MAG: hypothetical protein Q7J27_06900 [Syntrophales bacterium]|nr:hypothetical protein [Syntrophales bacterium]
MVKEVQAYPWSSYGEYIKKPEICDTQFAFSLFSANSKEALYLWEKFNKEINNPAFRKQHLSAKSLHFSLLTLFLAAA